MTCFSLEKMWPALIENNRQADKNEKRQKIRSHFLKTIKIQDIKFISYELKLIKSFIYTFMQNHWNKLLSGMS